MSEEKTEQPTHKKKEDSAKKGQMFLSRDFVGLLTLIAVSSFMDDHQCEGVDILFRFIRQ